MTDTLAKAKWIGDKGALPHGAEVDILAVDPSARKSRGNDVLQPPGRTAVWIRYWPQNRDFARYRSCDLSDLEVSDEDYARLIGGGQG